jgi:antitoxin (DNA-binding transcriptional repressor) of toxin-antitoxin stability system
MSVAEFKTNFSEALEKVRDGEEIEVLYGRAKKPVAVLSPPRSEKTEFELGILKGKMSFKINGDWKMTTEEFLGI